MKHIRTILALLTATFVLSTAAAVAAPVTNFAAADPTKPAATACATDTSAKGLVLAGSSQVGDSCNGDGVNNVIKLVVSTLSIIVGVAAVIVVLLAGFKYITAAGDSGKITSAKNTLVYAIIGIVVAALAQLIVATVFRSASDSATLCPTNTAISKNDAGCKA